MTTPSRCGRCGYPIPDAAPGGQCPVCLLESALLDAPAPAVDDAAPLAADLQPHFPNLAVLEPVGRGGMGVVFKARQTALDRVVALKILSPRLAADPEFVERFFVEARALARLDHPHIVTVHDVGRAGGWVFLVMEFVDGHTLRHHLRNGRLDYPTALRLVSQICSALEFAHGRGIVHRDMKPENVLIDPAGVAKVADFGLAKLDGSADQLTDAGTRMGTARYMAPEQRADAAGVDHRADIYSLGVMFYEMLTGDLPGPGFRPPSAKAGTDPRLDRVVARSLKDEPAERYQKAGEMRADVDRIATTRRWRKPLVGVGCVAALAAVFAVGVAFRGDPMPPPPPAGPTPPAPAVAALTPTDVLTSPGWAWTPPQNLGPGVNTGHDEVTPFVTDDGLTLLFASDRPGGHGSHDFWEARRASAAEPFADPVNLGPGVNSEHGEDAPCLSADGRTLAFVSYRGGNADIWTARRPAVGAAWGDPEPVAGVNSDAAEFRPWLSRDGLRLTFTSLRPPREGVWVCRRKSTADPFGPPEPFGKFSNRLALGGVSFSSDDRTLLCNRFDRVFPGDLLWLARVDSADEPFRNLVSFGPAVNADAVDTSAVAPGDGTAVYFQSDRPGGAGGHDLWLTRRVKKP